MRTKTQYPYRNLVFLKVSVRSLHLWLSPFNLIKKTERCKYVLSTFSKLCLLKLPPNGVKVLFLISERQNKSEGEIFLLPNLVTLYQVHITKQRAHEELKESEIETYGV